MPSSTLAPSLLPMPPQSILGDNAAMGVWFHGLTPGEQQAFAEYLLGMVESLPPKRRQIFDAVALNQPPSAIQPVESLGIDFAGLTGSLSNLFGGGNMGNVLGSVTSGLFGAGVNMLLGNNQTALQKDIAASQAQTAQYIASLQNTSAENIQKAAIEAQKEVQIKVVEQNAAVAFAQNNWKMLSVGGLALIGIVGLAIYLKRRKP